MLSPSQDRRVRRGGVSIHHDCWGESIVAGEPFLIDGIVTYFDGRRLKICTTSLRDEPPIEEVAIRRLVEEWIAAKGADSICLVGSAAVEADWMRPLGFRCVEREEGDLISSELLIPWAVLDRGNRRQRRARRRGFELAICRQHHATSDQLQLIEAFYQSKKIAKYNPETAFTLAVLLRSPRVCVIEVKRRGRLCGLLALHKPFVDTAIALCLAHDQQTPGVSDFLYCMMLECTRQLGARAVNVGPSATEGQYHFKSNWGGRPAVPPYHRARWVRGNLSRRRQAVWALRLLNRNVRSPSFIGG